MKRRTVIAVGTAALATMASVAAVGGSQPSTSSRWEDGDVVAHAISQKAVFDPIAKSLKLFRDQEQLRDRLAGCIEDIKGKGHFAELTLSRNEGIFLGVKAVKGAQAERVLFVRSPQMPEIFESLAQKFKTTTTPIDGGKITVI